MLSSCCFSAALNLVRMMSISIEDEDFLIFKTCILCHLHNLLCTPKAFLCVAQKSLLHQKEVLCMLMCSFAPACVYYNRDSWHTLVKTTLLYGKLMFLLPSSLHGFFQKVLPPFSNISFSVLMNNFFDVIDLEHSVILLVCHLPPYCS